MNSLPSWVMKSLIRGAGIPGIVTTGAVARIDSLCRRHAACAIGPNALLKSPGLAIVFPFPRN
jgi:hypothetical protein